MQQQKTHVSVKLGSGGSGRPLLPPAPCSTALCLMPQPAATPVAPCSTHVVTPYTAMCQAASLLQVLLPPNHVVAARVTTSSHQENYVGVHANRTLARAAQRATGGLAYGADGPGCILGCLWVCGPRQAQAAASGRWLTYVLHDALTTQSTCTFHAPRVLAHY
jgi:hypothetical protein